MGEILRRAVIASEKSSARLGQLSARACPPSHPGRTRCNQYSRKAVDQPQHAPPDGLTRQPEAWIIGLPLPARPSQRLGRQAAHMSLVSINHRARSQLRKHACHRVSSTQIAPDIGCGKPGPPGSARPLTLNDSGWRCPLHVLAAPSASIAPCPTRPCPAPPPTPPPPPASIG